MIRRSGIATLGQLLLPGQVDEINAHLDACPLYDKHVARDHQPYRGGITSTYDLGDILRAPYLLDLGLRWTSVAREYLGDDPVYLYSINVFNSYPNDGPLHRGIQEFHRDWDCENFVAMFIFLSDVLEINDGAHEFWMGTHEGTEVEKGSSLSINLGVRGSGFIADTFAYHRGVPPTRRPRRLAWIRWGTDPMPKTNVKDGITPIVIPGYEDHAELLRPLVQFDAHTR